MGDGVFETGSKKQGDTIKYSEKYSDIGFLHLWRSQAVPKSLFQNYRPGSFEIENKNIFDVRFLQKTES